MIRIARILCPVDLSDASRHALDHAVAIAHWYGASITVFHARPLTTAVDSGPGTLALPSPSMTAEERAALVQSLQAFATTEVGTGLDLSFDVGEGPAPSSILATADAMQADLIVMGTHGRSGLTRFLLGSVAETVLRKASCPVLTVPPRSPDVVPASPVAFRNIVCATDFSDCSLDALAYALSIAQEADADLTLVHAVPPLAELPADVPNREDVSAAQDVMVADIEADRYNQLHALVPDSVREFCTVNVVVTRGAPQDEILRVAKDRQCDLLVIGIRGRGATDRLIFGSTAQHLVRHASCPVLTLRKG